MLATARRFLAVAAAVLAASAAVAQVPAGSPVAGRITASRAPRAPKRPTEVAGYVATVEVRALAPT